MTGGVRISTMRVDAFRGISSETLFDFTSPITLVFAPNGTGKTTMCEAAEWLLTGQVERLRDRGHFAQAVLRSKFATTGPSPIVDAEIHLGGEAHRLQRVVVNSENQARIAAGVELGPVIRPHDLLARLAPAAAAMDSHHLRAIPLRQGWLRGTRFLSAEALATLVDSDDGTIERRKEVFADLLGIRHLLEAEKLAERYIADMSSRERVLAQTIGSQQVEITRLTAELGRTSAHALPSALSEVLTAEQRLSLSAPHPGDQSATLAERIEALDVERYRRQNILETRRSAVEASAAEWTLRAELLQRIAALNQAEPALAANVAQITELGHAAGRAIAAANARRDALNEQVLALETAQASLVPLCVRFIDAMSRLPQSVAVPPHLTLAVAFELFPQSRQTPEAISALGSEVRAALDSERAAADADRRIRLLREQFDAALARQVSEEALAALRTEVDRLEVEADLAKQRLEATASPLARLQTAGRELLDHQHVASAASCPLCSHDWGSSDRLREAMAATLAAVPALEQIAQQAVAASGEILRIARGHLDEAQRNTAQIERLRSELAGLEREAEARRARLARLGIDGEERIAALEVFERRIVAAAAVSLLIRERDRLSGELPASSTPLLPDTTPVQRLEAEVDAAIGGRQQHLQAELARIVKDLDEQSAAREALRKDHAVASETLRANREERARHLLEFERLRQLWQRAAPDTEWTELGLASARAWAAAEQARLEDVAARTAAAQAAWAAEVRRARLNRLQQDVAPLRDRLAYMRTRLEAAKRANEGFHESYVRVSTRQIEDLSRVVNPLFARMHANRVFDRIKLGQIDDPLRWLADAGSQELDPGKDFSQGQRQDLALALFLARARSLGGTFFLDEPVTHLDDLNRVGLLDIFRATVMESSSTLNLVITTASKPLARHLIEKFALIGPVETPDGRARPLRVIELDGNGRTGVSLRPVYPADG